MELHSVAREHCSLQLRFRRLEESRPLTVEIYTKSFETWWVCRQEGAADASSELLFLRRQSRLLEAAGFSVLQQRSVAKKKVNRVAAACCYLHQLRGDEPTTASILAAQGCTAVVLLDEQMVFVARRAGCSSSRLIMQHSHCAFRATAG